MDKNCIKIMIGSDLFDGFYNSMFSNSEEFIDDEMELKSELEDKIDDDSIKFDVEYNYSDEDWIRYKIDVCKAFRDVYMEAINDVLPTDIKDKEFLFESIDDSKEEDNISVYSPKYYNYHSDKCYWFIKTNYHTLKLIKDYTLKFYGAKRYLLRNYTSCDGFHSFIKNDIEYWRELDVKDMEDIYIIALLDMLLCLTDNERRFKLNYSVYDDVSKYEYAFPMVEYNKKTYELEEFTKLMDIKLWE